MVGNVSQGIPSGCPHSGAGRLLQIANLNDQTSDFLVGSSATRDHFRQHLPSECGDTGFAARGAGGARWAPCSRECDSTKVQ